MTKPSSASDEPNRPDQHGQPLRLDLRSPGAKGRSPACIYILRLTSGMLYIGVTVDLEHRWYEHAAGRGSRITSEDPPQGIVYSEQWSSLGEAHARERQLKRWTRAKKEALVARDLAHLQDLSRRRKN